MREVGRDIWNGQRRVRYRRRRAPSASGARGARAVRVRTGRDDAVRHGAVRDGAVRHGVVRARAVFSVSDDMLQAGGPIFLDVAEAPDEQGAEPGDDEHGDDDEAGRVEVEAG